MFLRTCASLLVLVFCLAGAASAETPSVDAVVAAAIDAAESTSTMAAHDMIRVEIHQEETTSDGETESRSQTAVFHGDRIQNLRVELTAGVSLGLSGSTGWAMIRGKVDDRPQTPKMAAGTIRQNLFPLLLPFSLLMEGVELQSVTQSTFDSRPVWAVEINFASGFFAAPSMVAPWRIFIDRESNLVLGAEYYPAEQFRTVLDEGIRYRYLKRQDVDGINLPAQVLLDGIDFNGVENGHVRVTKISALTAGPFDLALFINPDQAAKLEADEF